MKQRGTLERLLLRMTNVAMAGALDHWISNVKETKRHARVLERVVTRMKNSALVQVMELWRYQTSEQKQVRVKVLKVVQQLQRRILKETMVQVFELWRYHTAEEKEIRSKDVEGVCTYTNPYDHPLVRAMRRQIGQQDVNSFLHATTLAMALALWGLRARGGP
jgi:spore cortex formation protein SpoVR/YcgB (stage V sporulation)